MRENRRLNRKTGVRRQSQCDLGLHESSTCNALFKTDH